MERVMPKFWNKLRNLKRKKEKGKQKRKGIRLLKWKKERRY